MTNALRKPRKTGYTSDQLHDNATGQEARCEARCLAAALETVEVHGQNFRFCSHHANKVRTQLAAQAAADGE